MTVSEPATATITVLQLFPDELTVTGDNGNLATIVVRMQRAGFDVDVSTFRRGGDPIGTPDLVIVGNGPLAAMRSVHADLLRIAPELRALVGGGIPFFAVGAGAELLGQEIVLGDGAVLPGAATLPLHAVRGRARRVGYIVLETAHGRVVGFEDHATDWLLDADARPLGTVTNGGGNGSGAAEGLVFGSSIATHVQGPALPLNPVLADALIASVAARRGLVYTPGAAHAELDRLAGKARDTIMANLHQVFTSI